MLVKLIRSIAQSQVSDVIGKIDILVVDNDGEKSAESVVEAEEIPDRFNLHYHNHPIKGLASVRNEMIRQGLAFDPHFLIFIDDDEYVGALWLSRLVQALLDNAGDLAVGPVIPVFEQEVSPDLSPWFRYHKIDNYANINFIETGNLIIRSACLQRHPDLTFDHRFNTTGAEDSYFGVTAQKLGIKIWWAAEALAYENIPVKRASLQWLIRRAYRGAITYTFIILLEKQYAKIVRKIVVNFTYFFLGLGALILVPFRTKYRYYGPLKIAESIGGFAGLLQLKYHEYSSTR